MADQSPTVTAIAARSAKSGRTHWLPLSIARLRDASVTVGLYCQWCLAASFVRRRIPVPDRRRHYDRDPGHRDPSELPVSPTRYLVVFRVSPLAQGDPEPESDNQVQCTPTVTQSDRNSFRAWAKHRAEVRGSFITTTKIIVKITICQIIDHTKTAISHIK